MNSWHIFLFLKNIYFLAVYWKAQEAMTSQEQWSFRYKMNYYKYHSNERSQTSSCLEPRRAEDREDSKSNFRPFFQALRWGGKWSTV